MAIRPIHLRDEDRSPTNLLAVLKADGIEALLITTGTELDTIAVDHILDLALIDVGAMSSSVFAGCVRRCVELKMPTIALASKEQIPEFEDHLEVDDFILTPAIHNEMVARARRVLHKRRVPESAETVHIGDLTINAANYEVLVKGKPVNLRFKEYELLLLMASNPGRVYTRENLLSSIWGYDYLGGTRTVDVHIRRLRSKIEDAEHSFIETVWNVGYRFRDKSPSV